MSINKSTALIIFGIFMIIRAGCLFALFLAVNLWNVLWHYSNILFWHLAGNCEERTKRLKEEEKKKRQPWEPPDSYTS